MASEEYRKHIDGPLDMPPERQGADELAAFLHEKIMQDMNCLVKKLEGQIHFLVEILTERQLDEFIRYCEHQNQ